MKKYIAGLGIIALLAACGNGDSEDQADANGTENEGSTTEETVERVDEEVEIEQEEPDSEGVEILEEQHYRHGGTEMADGMDYHFNYYAKIENNNEYPVDIFGSSLSWYDDAGNVATTNDGHTIDVYPEVIQPGEEAYVSVWAGTSLTDEDIEDVELSIVENEVHHHLVEEIETDNVNVNDDLSTTGEVTNISEYPAIETHVVTAFYDSDDTFLGVTTDFIEGGMEPDQKMGFDSNAQYDPDEIADEFEYEETNAYILPGADQ